MDRVPPALLAGCSSGAMAPRGDFEPTGVVAAYLQAGCPLAVANLWDVTDRDIDRYSKGLLEAWLGAAQAVGGKGGGGGVSSASVFAKTYVAPE